MEKVELTNIDYRNETEISDKISIAIGECQFEFVVDDILTHIEFSPEDVPIIEKLISIELDDYLREGRIKVNEEKCCYYWTNPNEL